LGDAITILQTYPACLDLTRSRATISIHSVQVVTRFVASHDSIATKRGSTSFTSGVTNPAWLDFADTRAAIIAFSITVIAFFVVG
jgi:hypothetical protein